MNTQTPEEIQNRPFFYKPFFIEPKNNIFAERAIRFDELAQVDESGWREYLALMVTVCRAQDSVLNHVVSQVSLPEHQGETRLPESDGMTIPAHFYIFLQHLIAELQGKVNDTVQTALNDLVARSETELNDMAARVLRDEVAQNEQPFKLWLHAALQCAWTAWAVQLKDGDVAEQEDRTHCPCCGGDAVASVVLNGGDWHGLRYLHCALCNSRWNALRAKCTFCNDQSAISLEKIEDVTAPDVYKGARAECCGKCGHYRKLFLLPEQQYADTIADDLASLALDVLVGEEGSLRGGHNPFLLG
ncbi:formate dehydrogenase accessory protein FdhE [Neisseriaceae bacterium B1]